MKKILLCAAVIGAVMTSASAAYAVNGDIIGDVYSTDIRTYINDIEIPAYNIGGKTVVAIEDITTESLYNDILRILTINSVCFSPEALIQGDIVRSEHPGAVIGDIYETDIKTFYQGIEINSYNVGGKTAVAIEDLGGNGDYNILGGRYVYDDEARTLKLEMQYKTTPDTLEIDTINNEVSAKRNGNDIQNGDEESPDYNLREQVINEKMEGSLFREVGRVERDNYLFVYAIEATQHGSNSHLLLIQNDGSYHDYSEDFEAINESDTLLFEDVTLDAESETCTFTVFDQDYVIDLETGEITEV